MKSDKIALLVFGLLIPASLASADWDDVKKTVLLSKSDTATLPEGSFSVLQEWAQLESGPMFNEVMTGNIAFTPSRSAPVCRSISFVQMAQVLDNHGKNYEWPLDEAPRNTMRSRAGFFVDHLASQCNQGEKCSPFYRDFWPNTEEGSKDGSVSSSSTVSAVLVDYPFGWEFISSIRLEACAVCRDTMKVYGCFNWGGHWGLTSDRAFHPVSATSTPSAEWNEALQRFNGYYSRP
jgi:hypothetical protein